MANFDFTRVNPMRLTGTADNISECITILSNALNTVDETLNSTLRPTWQGPASSDFFTQYTHDLQGFNAFTNALRNCNEKLKQAAGIYDTADNNALSLVNELRAE